MKLSTQLNQWHNKNSMNSNTNFNTSVRTMTLNQWKQLCSIQVISYAMNVDIKNRLNCQTVPIIVTTADRDYNASLNVASYNA